MTILSNLGTAGQQRFGRAQRVSVKSEAYWPEIDGLRTVAVLSVFLFHLDARILAGGFVGVDIFFVISGFLITNILARDIEAKQFSLLRFYQRRIARIAPAALLVIAFTLVGGYFLYSAQDFASVGANVLAATLSFINIKLLFQGSYFQLSPDAQPLLHYWSLAIEEQFYLIFPLLLYIVMRMTRRPLIILFTCLALSYVACVMMTLTAPTASFYLLPTRAWELLAGSCLTLAKRHNVPFPAKYATANLAFGLFVLILSFVYVREAGFPGWIAILPVAGATLVLASVGVGEKSIVHRGLAHPAMVFAGKRSYSLYLWHWPIFSFVNYYFYQSGLAITLILKVVVSIVATMLTYRFIENPSRRWLNSPKNLYPAFGLFVTAAIALGVTGYVVRTNYYLTAEASNIASGGVAVNPNGSQWVVVIGDSQGAMYGYEFASLARRLGFRLNILASAAGNELPGESNTLWPQVLQFLGAHKPDVVVLAQAWSAKLGPDGEEHFRAAIEGLSSRAGRIIILMQPPVPSPDATRQAILGGLRPPFFEDPAIAKSRQRVRDIIRKFESEKIQVLDVSGSFLLDDNTVRLVAPDGRLTYQDNGHLSDAGTALVRPKLEEALHESLNTAQ